MRAPILLAALVALSACDSLGLNLPLPNIVGGKGESQAVVTRDEVTLKGAHGFCIDPQSSTRGQASAFIVFGNCAAITGSWTAPQPDANAIVTTTVRLADPALPRIGNSNPELVRFFDSDVGHILISRANDRQSVSVLESGATDEGAFFLYVTDTSDGAPDGTEDTYWRAYLDAKNSVVTISVLSLDADPLSRAQGLGILRKFTNAIQSVPSNSIDPVVVTKPPTTRPSERPSEQIDAETPPDPQKTRSGRLGRLFG